jgi:hypothetical protein
MEEMIERIIKLILVLTLVLAALSYWLLPKTKLAKHLKTSETLYMSTHVIGITCGIIGLVGTFVWPQLVVRLHLWELIAMPYALIWIYWLMILRTSKSSEVCDEKQEYDMTKATTMAMWLSIVVMGCIIFPLYGARILEGAIWYPTLLFLVILVYSFGTLFYFKFR